MRTEKSIWALLKTAREENHRAFINKDEKKRLYWRAVIVSLQWALGDALSPKSKYMIEVEK